MKFKLYSVIIILALTNGLFSAPRLINDNRVEELNGFPTLGRGYAINSNHLQSMCFKSVVTSKPTFDLNYDIEEVTDDYLTKLLVSGRDRIQNSRLNKFIKDNYATEEKSDNRSYVLKNLIVKADINQYYYSMDETQSALSDSVKELLKKKQYITFFNSCGHFYVRSVGTFSTYYALLQYRLTGERDEEFRNDLEKGLFNFYEETEVSSKPAVKTGGDKEERAEAKSGTASGSSGKTGSKEYSKLTEDAKARGLRVYVQGIGLSKGDPVNLIPVNIRQFRTTIQEAVKLMQDPDSGLVNAIEVVPWMENPEFGRILASDIKEGGAEQFIRQQKIEENTGVITELYRKSNSQVELYNLSSMCRKVILDHYSDKSEGSLYRSLFGQGIKTPEKKKEFTLLDESIIKQLIDKRIRRYDGNRTIFYNLSNENDREGYISLNDFIKYFYGNPPERFLEINRYYLYGDHNDGALDCINRLYDKLDTMSYRDIPSCMKAMKDVELNSTFLNQYCLPKPVRVVHEGDEVKAPVNERGRRTDETIKGEIPHHEEKENDAGQGKDKIESLEDINKKNQPGTGTEEKKKKPEKENGEIKSFDDMMNQ